MGGKIDCFDVVWVEKFRVSDRFPLLCFSAISALWQEAATLEGGG